MVIMLWFEKVRIGIKVVEKIRIKGLKILFRSFWRMKMSIAMMNNNSESQRSSFGRFLTRKAEMV